MSEYPNLKRVSDKEQEQAKRLKARRDNLEAFFEAQSIERGDYQSVGVMMHDSKTFNHAAGVRVTNLIRTNNSLSNFNR